ncbi:MAG: hypothetical protein M1814_001142 [Vezdaea aestivalis]|nr:MAG: hypothetical protein M1814_001142 [Vezdaea aestivalis]
MASSSETQSNGQTSKKLHGRAFWESLGSPRLILAPMVDQSEFAWRMLTRSFMSSSEKADLLSYTPMFHSRLFNESDKYRNTHFQPTRGCLVNVPGNKLKVGENETPLLDGRHDLDRPLFVQFCANDPDQLLSAAKQVEHYCDAVDLNLGCPQGIAKKGKYGAFLQEDQDLIVRLIRRLHNSLSIPVTAKMRILEDDSKTLEYAQRLSSAGASIITVHGRQRHQKGHYTGLADWSTIRHLRANIPAETVLFANGNILQHADIDRCLAFTGADGVMSAEGNLTNPAIFASPPPPGSCDGEYWRGRSGQEGWRVDAVIRRYFDILYRYALEVEPPVRKPLALPTDTAESVAHLIPEEAPRLAGEEEPPRKKQKKGKEKEKREKMERVMSPNLIPIQPHLFNILRHLVAKHTDIRDRLARVRSCDLAEFENVLLMVEYAVWKGMREYEDTPEVFSNGNDAATELDGEATNPREEPKDEENISSAHSKPTPLPFWVCQSYVRPLPEEAIRKGAVQLSKKEIKKQAAQKPQDKVAEDEQWASLVSKSVAGEKRSGEALEGGVEFDDRSGLARGGERVFG